ncbi:MAG: Uma2 family endonuclease, partial [Actinomycetota bacterium]|nr:Uma2 family endonuclease [Actinomycetota bacterium]
MVNEPLPYRFSVEEYEQMGETGILGPDARLELLDGEIVEMSPIGSRHAACVDRLNELPSFESPAEPLSGSRIQRWSVPAPSPSPTSPSSSDVTTFSPRP